MLVCTAAESERTEFLFTRSRYSTLRKKKLFVVWFFNPLLGASHPKQNVN